MSALQVIYTAFPGAIRYVGRSMARVRDVGAAATERLDPLSHRVREGLARRMEGELARVVAHQSERMGRFAPASDAVRDGGEGGDGSADELPGIFDLGDDPVHDTGRHIPSASVRAADIGLIEVDANTVVRTKAFPR